MDTRYVVEPDPAWDLAEVRDGVLTVELSWMPDALAGRPEQVVASPDLVRALEEAGVTGFGTAPARGYFSPDGFEVDEHTPVPELVELKVGADPAGDIYDEPSVGLVVSERALEVLRRYCSDLDVKPLGA